ncbi:predicted protein [Histoplasma mississippiense (nom. inval.)]|uniref:predicted protein n=1 Tax=Ajellomyces capsulatus (strain NAm1 / WU24) TaxID=2059318 RepID=UPI000157C4C6|nr:predicted protein [Histoplasma mississippiense (nom. inval.)]EDN08714.1 predicted protein [Histoplasma mississippiense (nom. inval.)]
MRSRIGVSIAVASRQLVKIADEHTPIIAEYLKTAMKERGPYCAEKISIDFAAALDLRYHDLVITAAEPLAQSKCPEAVFPAEGALKIIES